jgi:hypothetical protein
VLAPTVAYGQGGGMFYSGDNLTVVLFLAGFGVTFIMEGRKQRGWERRTLFCIGGVLLASATGWHWVKSLYQPLTGFLISLARNPETWLLLLVFAAIVIALGRKAPAEATPSAAPVTEQPPPLPLPRTKLTDFRWIDKQDVFTLHEASCYWAEEGLSGNDVKSPDAAGAWRMLNAAIVGKQLKAIEYSFGDMMSGRSTEARLTRVDLIVFATSKNERPRFLFPELREQGGKVAAPAPTAGISVSAPPTAKVEPAFGEPLPKLPALMLLNPLTDRTPGNNVRLAFVSGVITIRNESLVDLSECRILIDRYELAGETVEIKAQLDPGGPKSNDHFALRKAESRRLRLTGRDLADVVNDPPHRIPLEGGAFIDIRDNQRCVLHLRLTSNAKRVTVAAIEITTGAPEQVSVKILDQHLEGA